MSKEPNSTNILLTSELPDALLATKLLRPPARPDLVSRPQLKQLLDEGLQHKLTLVSAPAGFGKTTLLSRWIPSNGCPIAWVSLHTSDNDPVQFWSYFISALQTLRPQFGDETLNQLRASQPPPIESILTALINSLAMIPGDLAVILDDYHVIDSQSIHGALSFLLDHLPPQLHLIIASRTDPPLPLARLRGKAQLIELRAADLSFTHDETITFFNEVMRLNLSPEEVAVLGKRTEGWAVGLQLAALSLRGRKDVHRFIEAFAGGHHHVLDYLVEEVLGQQPENVQSFLLRTSILDRLTGPLCEALTGQGESQAMLERLERANLFTVPLDDERRWYRYHNLFADVLRARLQWTHPNLVPELHRRACAWYAEHGLAAQGVSHAMAAGDSELAVRLIEENAADLLKRGEYFTIIDWIKSLDDNLIRSRPRLCFLHAWALAETREFGAAEARLQDLERFFGLSPDTVSNFMASGAKTEAAETQRMIAGDLAIRAIIADHRGNVPLALDISRRALEVAGEDQTLVRFLAAKNLASAFWLNGDVAGASKALAEARQIGQAAGYIPHVIVSLSQLAGVQVVEGNLHEAARIYRQTLQLTEEQGTQSLSGTGAPHVGMGWLLYEWNDLEGAAFHATKGIELAKQDRLLHVMLPGYGVLVRVDQARGDLEAARATLQHAEQLARSNNLTQNLTRLSTYKVRLWLARGNIEAAGLWAEGLGEGELSYQREAQNITLARVRLAQGRPTEAADLLGKLLQAAEETGRKGSAIKILALQALALKAQGDIDKALAALARAIFFAATEGYMRTFVDLGTPMATLLSKLLEEEQKERFGSTQHISKSYLSSLISAFGSLALPQKEALSPQKLVQTALEPLSERELEVLRLIAAGRLAPEIAREFVVAVSTIRTHIKNIYGKLGAHNRAQAIAKARNLDLLP